MIGCFSNFTNQKKQKDFQTKEFFPPTNIAFSISPKIEIKRRNNLLFLRETRRNQMFDCGPPCLIAVVI